MKIANSQKLPPVTAISAVQGSGPKSPLEAQQVTVSGVVTGIQRTGPRTGFFIQDPVGDKDLTTSDALYVRMQTPSEGLPTNLAVGSKVTVTGAVDERGTLTSVEVATLDDIRVDYKQTSKRPEIEWLNLPNDPTKRERYLEAREGMLVGIKDALVVGPTSLRNQFVVADAQTHGTKRVTTDNQNASGFMHASARLGPRAAVSVGDRITNLVGPLAVSNGNFEILPIGNAYESHTRSPQPPSAYGDINANDRFDKADRTAIKSRIPSQAHGPLDPADLNGDGKISRADLNRFDWRKTAQDKATTPAPLSIATLNAQNFFDDVENPPESQAPIVTSNSYQLKLAKLASTIRDSLRAPDVLALQEVENPKVLEDLISRPELQGLGYKFVVPPTTGKRSINPALLWREDRADLSRVRQVQTERDANLSEELVWQQVRSLNPVKIASRGPLFSREPLIVELNVKHATDAKTGAQELSTPMTFIVNHLISKYSPHGSDTTPIRTEQARVLRSAVEQLRSEQPDNEIVLLGDLNDTSKSHPLRELSGPAKNPTLVNALNTKITPENERYSYVYEGVSQLIDHVFVTPGLVDKIVRAGVRHGNSDVPASEESTASTRRSTDHDSPYIWLDI